MEKKFKLPFGEKMSYMIGGMGMCICFLVVGNYLLYFYTDIVMLTPAVAANIFLITRFWDAVNDPIMGVIVDKRPFNKKGKKNHMFRPWLLVGAPIVAVMFILCFTCPSFLGTDMGKTIWCFLFYIGYTMAQTIVQVPYGAMTSAITSDLVERGELGTYRNLGEALSGVVMSLTLLPLVSVFSNNGQDLARGYALATVVLAIVAVIFIVICWKKTKERVVVPKSENGSLKKNFGMLLKNRPAILIIIFMFGSAVVVNFRFAYLNYYVRTYMELGDGAVTSLSTIYTIAWALFFFVNIILFKKFEKRTCMIITGITFVLSGLIFILAGRNMPVVIFATIVNAFAAGLAFSVVWGTATDGVEYGAWKTGIYAPAFIFAIVTFSQKCGIGIASFIGGASLSSIGYVGGEVATEAVQNGIFWWNNLVLIICGVLLFAVGIPYNLSKKKYDQILVELGETEKTDAASAE